MCNFFICFVNILTNSCILSNYNLASCNKLSYNKYINNLKCIIINIIPSSCCSYFFKGIYFCHNYCNISPLLVLILPFIMYLWFFINLLPLIITFYQFLTCLLTFTYLLYLNLITFLLNYLYLAIVQLHPLNLLFPWLIRVSRAVFRGEELVVKRWLKGNQRSSTALLLGWFIYLVLVYIITKYIF